MKKFTVSKFSTNLGDVPVDVRAELYREQPVERARFIFQMDNVEIYHAESHREIPFKDLTDEMKQKIFNEAIESSEFR